MSETLRFFKENEVFIYLVLGLFAIWQFRKFFLAWGELRNAAFGLERQSAQYRLNRVTAVLIFIVMLGIVEFMLVSFVVPTVPAASPMETPTLDLLALPTVTVDPNLTVLDTTQVPDLDSLSSNCVPGKVDILSPGEGDSVRDIVEIIGSADIPNFAFYKFEMSKLNETSWLTIQAGEIITTEGSLGYWDTSLLNPGDYALRLIIVDNQGQSTEPCVVQVRVEPPTEEE